MKRISVEKVYKNRVLQHTLFWLLSYYILLRVFANADKIQKIDYIYTVLFHTTMMIGVYINLVLLIPKILSKRNFIFYIVTLLIVIASTTELNILFFDKLVDFILPGYYFISYYEFGDIIKFVIVFIVIASLIKLAKSWFTISEINKKVIELQKEKTEFELKALKGQINPHFLFNSLNGIYSLALSRSEKTSEIVLMLSDIMRYIIYEASANFVNLKKEVKCLQDYIALQKLRSDDRATITVDISGELEHKQIAPLIFFPLVENSFKHGIKGVTGKSFVTLKLIAGETNIAFIIENNKGITDNVENNTYKGIGLENVRQRLQMIYPHKHQFKITDTAETFKVEITINTATDEN
jgi:sensor histidine kinase YesM